MSTAERAMEKAAKVFIAVVVLAAGIFFFGALGTFIYLATFCTGACLR